MRKNDMYG
uniref:InlA n=1 Tax=Listeria monocytogenes TaxID=1639 RepID=D1FMQ7_LISMN|nr:InlA [Listeria monocytogenes]ACA05658.1 InlA [Listeria monocytogenes]ACA05671.1 InlA [Listeria monocytogenes]ACA05687.1 InlA [Listeria monocytogenes]ADI77442.1 truncated internalin A [Listeria monocytogenes]